MRDKIRKCLRVGAKSGHKHCHDTYICRHPSHDPQKGHHVLVCEKHKKIPENEKLLDKFKREVIYKHEDLPSKSTKIKTFKSAKFGDILPSQDGANLFSGLR